MKSTRDALARTVSCCSTLVTTTCRRARAHAHAPVGRAPGGWSGRVFDVHPRTSFAGGVSDTRFLATATRLASTDADEVIRGGTRDLTPLVVRWRVVRGDVVDAPSPPPARRECAKTTGSPSRCRKPDARWSANPRARQSRTRERIFHRVASTSGRGRRGAGVRCHHVGRESRRSTVAQRDVRDVPRPQAPLE